MNNTGQHIQRLFQELRRLLRVALTRPSLREIEGSAHAHQTGHRLQTTALVLRETIFQIRKQDLNTKSAALTYSCILSLGPLLAVAFLVFQWAGGFNLLIDETLLPLISSYFSPHVADQLKEYLKAFVQNFKPGLLGAVALVTFLVTIVGLLSGIEKAVNNIFAVEVHRPLWRQALNYWLVLTLTPFVVVASSSKTTEALGRYEEVARLFHSLSFLGLPLTILAQSLGFSLLFYLLPNRRIPMKALIAGGLAAGVLFRLLQYVNVFLTRNVLLDSTATQLYGTAPIIAVAFFFWIKLVWMVILSGACLSVAIMNIEEVARPSRESEAPMDDLMHCTHAFAAICSAFRRTGEGIALANLAQDHAGSRGDLERWLGWMERRKVILQAEYEGARHYFPTHHGLTLEKDPSLFIDKILLAKAAEGQMGGEQLPFAGRVEALLRQSTKESPRDPCEKSEG